MTASPPPARSWLRNVLGRVDGGEVALQGGLGSRGVVRVGDTVRGSKA